MNAKTAAIVALATLLMVGCSSPSIPTASGAPPAPSTHAACTDLHGTVDQDKSCRIHSATSSYTLDMSFPVDYPESQPVIDFLTKERGGFVAWVADAQDVPRSLPYELDVDGTEYRSGTAESGTQSLVFDVYDDTGIHPVTTYRAFNYDLANRAPITFDTLFKPGSRPLDVLNPIVARELKKRDVDQSDALGADVYQTFAITDDAVTFYFNQDGLLPHEAGPLEISVPRAELASLLA